MSRRITITHDGSIVVLRGWRVAQLARQAGLRPTYAGTVQGWMLDAKRLPDLVGWLEYRNVRYELENEPQEPSQPVAVNAGCESPQEPEGSLW